MIRDITIGQFYPAQSPLHRLDPRVKLLATLLYVTLLFLVRDPLWFIPIAATVLALYRAAKVPLRFLARGLRGILFLLLVTFFFRATMTPGQELAGFWIFSVTREGLMKAALMTSRIGLMICGAALLSYTTTPRALADGLEVGLGFLERVKIPVHAMAVITMIAFRFIPVLMEEVNHLMDAQASRGAEFHRCSLWKKCRNVVFLLLPLFFSVLRRSADLAMAMEARGYREGAETTRMHPLVFARRDRLALAAAWTYFAVFGGLILLIP